MTFSTVMHGMMVASRASAFLPAQACSFLRSSQRQPFKVSLWRMGVNEDQQSSFYAVNLSLISISFRALLFSALRKDTDSQVASTYFMTQGPAGPWLQLLLSSLYLFSVPGSPKCLSYWTKLCHFFLSCVFFLLYIMYHGHGFGAGGYLEPSTFNSIATQSPRILNEVSL